MRTLKKCIAAILALAATASTISLYGINAYTVSSGSAVISQASLENVQFTAQGAADEAAYAEWSAVSGASGYNVYVKKAGGSYTQLDTMLVRQYASCFRADAVGLAAGEYTLKVVPVINGAEDPSKASESAALTVTQADRSGFAFQNSGASIGNAAYGCGGYQTDGTLASDAQVIYITADTVNTVQLDVITDSKGKATSCTGLAEILTARKKGYDLTPLVIRMVGEIKAENITGLNSNGYLEVKGCSNVTLEGIGKDATVNGWGILVRDATNVEVKNLGVMLFPDDGISLDTANTNVWVHNCDIFYGTAGSDADQAKGDGSMDVKKDSRYITFSYNHFWDSGKCSLCGMTSETGENWITYHHNWFDHSDSRHPRIRTMSVHVYNNYYDGNSKYGVGVTMGASCFVENNYFRNCKYPMLSSMQGSDADGEGTFSGEDGGMIKSFGNYIEGAKAVITQNDTADKKDIDCYEASSRTEAVPADYITTAGGTAYNNFDTSDTMYSYTVDAAKDVPAVVTAKAGRMQGGDFQFTFNNETDDASYAINAALMSQIRSYQSSVIAIGSGFTDTTQEPATEAPVKPTDEPVETQPVTDGEKETDPPSPVITGEIIYCAPDASGSGKTPEDPANVLDAIEQIPAGGAIYLLEGTYKFDETILIDQNNSGQAGAYKTISAYNGAEVVFDFSAMQTSSSSRGVVLDGSYWHFYGFEIQKAGDNGMLLSGSNNLIEMMEFFDNQDTGLQISRYRTEAASIAEWPCNNRILNCTSRDNCDDETMENADGFAAKLTCGEGNVFDGCMSYNNSDDGWDLYAKAETGPIGVVTIQNCIAFRNGYTEFGEGYGDCDGNGFKLGGGGIGTAHVVKNCLAFENLNCGFTDNNNPELGTLIDCTAVNNNFGGNGKANYYCYRCTDCDFDNLVSWYDSTKESNDKFTGSYCNGVYYNSGYYLVSADTPVNNGDKIGTKYDSAPDMGFISTNAPALADMADFHSIWRNPDGSLNTSGYYETTGTFGSMGYHLAAYTEPETNAPTEEPVVTVTKYGDTNESGDVEIGDVILLCQATMGTKQLSTQGAINADVDLNGEANATDAALILQNIVKLTELPVQ